MDPYGPPGQRSSFGNEASASASFTLAALGALLAALYWAGMTLLIGVSVATGGLSGAQIIIPVVLIALYAVRAFQIFKGDPSAAQKVLWLHGVGGAMAVIQMVQGAGGLLTVLNVIKLGIHAFGGITAYLVTKRYR